MLSQPERKQINAAIAIVIRASDLRLLIAQRKDGDVLGGYWEFPGGKCEDGESLEQCVVRELLEELALRATPIHALPPVEHDYPDARLILHPFICRHEFGHPQLIECQDARWIEVAELPRFRFPPANEALIENVIALLKNRSALGF